MTPDTYLGDGVYASYDGYHVWLAVNDHQNRVVALEPEVIEALFKYIKSMTKPDWYKYVCIETAAGHMASWQSCSPLDANLRLGFDGETGDLKSAEVLK